ncbi:KamA family radical SAM protein [Desulfosarcina sp. OttesenSCG-928-A07]|nr:KamA family radical SAM protein [Desulfosarcina sp. OttesenSCG-928-G17]MDL2329846.1 KamA family radical SAM protein [Desulfosarcina sp. OttesenSCG-928-A07]
MNTPMPQSHSFISDTSEPAPLIPEGEDEPPEPGALATTPVSRPHRHTFGQIVRFPIHRAGIINPAARLFRKKFFPGISTKLWNDWQWQVRNRIHTAARLEAMISLSDAERLAFTTAARALPLGITPYYMSLVAAHDPDQPIRRTVVPTVQESIHTAGEADDPLGEDAMSPVPGLVHRYPDRVLLLLSDFCSTYCRYCTRSRMMGHAALYPNRSRLEQAFAYIEQAPSIRDVLISGGDPLLLGDEKLSWILSRLRQIPHVEILRIGTKVPAVLPQRITPRLVRMLRHYHPLWVSVHFTHPDECTPEATRACSLLADAGIPLGSQTVLLKGVNDNLDTMRQLVHGLLKMRVRPYYLYQCDPISGSAHFRTPVQTGIDIIKGLRGFTTGYALPTYVIDAPGGGGKIPLMPDYVEGREENDLVLRNYENQVYRYPDPCAACSIS